MTVTDAATTDEARVNALVDQLLAELDPRQVPAKDFLGRQFDLGLAWVHHPEGLGGLGLSPKLQRLINERVFAAGAVNPMMVNPMGYGMGAPTIATHGSEEQQRRYLRPIFTCEELWCQMFSEPGAGSDVAGLGTRAVRDGDEWVINGQKVWTSLAHLARWGMLLARTDPEQPKHKGMSYFVIDMHQPGVEVRPLRQITGEAEFNEVYFTDARIPDRERMGDVGDGWRVAITTLMNERVSIGGSIAPRGSGLIGQAVELFRSRGITDPAVKDELMRFWIRAEILRLTNIRASANRKASNPGPEGSIAKLAMAELNKELSEFVVSLLGPEGMLLGDSYELRRSDHTKGYATFQKQFLRARANSIEGGTSEVMRNILGERTLGLPGDVRTDKDLPWTQIPKN
ncbi:MAG: acyl-CoA dehydrogenase family protein [Acidimicrobiales bacterium]